MESVGLGIPNSWFITIIVAIVWLGVMLVYSPFADWLASRWTKKPPHLDSFRAIQKSKLKLIVGIVLAWIFGGILEELILRGIILKAVQSFLTTLIVASISTGLGIIIAAVCAFIIHFYQGLRAMIIIVQLSVLFGILFVVSGYNLWAVILCHGLYDTVAFIRFAKKKSKYSDHIKNDL